MVRRVALAIAGVAATLTVVTACSGGSTHHPKTTEQSVNPPTSTSRTTPTTPTSPATSTDTTLAPLTITASATATFGDKTVRTAWQALADWIHDNGCRPDLVATLHPTEDSLQPIYDQMTATAAADLRNKVHTLLTGSSDRATTEAIETLTAIGVTSHGLTVVDGASAVTEQAITSATADITKGGALAVTATSQAEIHFTDAASNPSHSTFTRTVTYTLAEQDGRWLIDQWDGTYNTAAPQPG